MYSLRVSLSSPNVHVGRKDVDVFHFQGPLRQHPGRVQQEVRRTHRPRQPGEVPEEQWEGLERLRDREGEGVGEHEYGLGQELPRPAPSRLLSGLGGQTRGTALQNVGLSVRLLHAGGFGLCHETKRRNLSSEKEEHRH